MTVSPDPGVDLARAAPAPVGPRQVAVAAVPSETGALLDHILARFHEVHRRELPELLRLARKVERVHGDHPQAPRGLGDELHHLGLELESHMQKEELVLFPLMRACSEAPPPMIRHPIAQMRHEHDEHTRHLAALRALTNDLALPDGACRSWQALYAGVGKLIDDLREHIQLENDLLFARFAPDTRA